MSTVLRLARGLGLLSLALGIVQLAAPRQFAEWIGVQPKPERIAAVRFVGLRGLLSGVGLLGRSRPIGWTWLRVLGDLMDIRLLQRALESRTVDRRRVGQAVATVTAIAAIDLLASFVVTRRGRELARHAEQPRGIRVRKAITVDKPREEVYRFWRNLENLPRFMENVESVRAIGEREFHWKVKAPGGTTVEWDARIVAERPNELISWRTLETADVENMGTVRFDPAPGDRGTEVKVDLTYAPPAGRVGAVVARLAGREPGIQVEEDLQRFKQVMETGHVEQSEAAPGIEAQLGQRPGQPPAVVPGHAHT